MKRRDWSGPIIYLLAAVLLVLSCAGCASAEGHRMVADWQDARGDGAIDDAEIRMLDRDAEELDAALRAPPIKTGFPLIDLLVPIVTAGVAGVGAHRYTMRKRDRSRAKALEEVKTA